MSRFGGQARAGISLQAGLLAAAAAIFMDSNAEAQVGVEVTDPPVLEARRDPAAAESAAAGEPGERLVDLTIEYVDGTIYDPVRDRDDKVRLRSYTQGSKLPDGRYVSPTITTRPGETLRVNLHNDLPPDPSCLPGGDHGQVNVPHCFNGTNLHTHGLWVNPAGNGDNVLLSINPTVSFEYEFAIPPEHPAGTFWYHTHRHGSTALQVSSGMAGALIIEGNRLPTPTKTGDLDTLLRGMEDRVLVMQQIQYACRGLSVDGKLGRIKRTPPPYGTKGSDGIDVGPYRCDPKDVGAIESYDDIGFGKWPGSGRYTTINGLILPSFRAKQGQVERWRMIHAGIYDTISLTFRKARRGAKLKPGPRLSAQGTKNWVDRNCIGEPLRYYLAAADGLTLDVAQPTSLATFQAGYRFDALVAFPEAGAYCVIDALAPAQGAMPGSVPDTRLLGLVAVEPDTPPVAGDADRHLTDALVAAAERNMPPGVRQAVIADLVDGLKLGRFTSELHPDIGAVDSRQELTFVIPIPKEDVDDLSFMVANEIIDDRPKLPDPRLTPYDPKLVNRVLTLGTAEEWTLTSPFGGHPFHIHVNPFQIVEIRDPNNKDVSLPGVVDDYQADPKNPTPPDPQYRGLKGMWKDTLWVKQGYHLKIRTRYQRYIGEFVLHCHILDHEDQGMMQNVAIVLPGGTPASVNAPEAGPEGSGHGH